MTEQREVHIAHLYRTLVPMVPLRLVARQTETVAESVELLRSRDVIHPYMYLPPLPGALHDEPVTDA